jgi:NADH:ubiquinone oxidoreductase subunit 4 (subunit M)
MFIAAMGFVVMAIGSHGLPSKQEVVAGADFQLMSPMLLIGTYFILTVAYTNTIYNRSDTININF